jgi:hypothetical protein
MPGFSPGANMASFTLTRSFSSRTLLLFFTTAEALPANENAPAAVAAPVINPAQKTAITFLFIMSSP